ncbi:MAG: 4-(cytidine 5'-diphospho)-2-C-methyl-D-erythritol kinase [Oscillospiraceae bacterium]|nr:4-(cytidine 5'-diphospho)-2-C-methyl-D-erythritol kinase [Oscillospiraceae bacterium]
MVLSKSAYGKINLSLDIIAKRSDGYHDIKTVMQTIALCDTITIECVLGEGINIENSVPYLPNNETNIAVMAAIAFYQHTGISGYNTNIHIEKNIPVSAGLGGGSADGACVLRMLDEIHDTKLGIKTLESIGESFGSDVPFCVEGGTVLAGGRGEILTALTPIPESFVLVSKPSFSSSTSMLYSLVRLEKIRARPDTDGILEALSKGDIRAVAQRFYNVFEDIMEKGRDEVADIKSIMHDNHTLGAAMSGSGPTVFGFFDDENLAKNAYALLKENYVDTYLTTTIGKY